MRLGELAMAAVVRVAMGNSEQAAALNLVDFEQAVTRLDLDGQTQGLLVCKAWRW